MAIDHETEALRLVAVDNTSTIGWKTADAQHLANLAEAQMHATLYLAEQQRIANLIAFLEAEGGPYKYINEVQGGHQNALTKIYEALGL